MGKLRVFEAFSGYGSQSIALRNLGIDYEVVGISEIDCDALISYSAIRDLDKLNMDISKTIEEMKEELMVKNVGYDFKKQKSSIPRMKEEKLKKVYLSDILSNNFGDISLINENLIPEHDLFTYSFPCTDISVAGKQEGLVKGKTRSGLLYECEKIIEVKRPKYLLLENVKNLVGKKYKKQFDEWLNYLETLGYTNYWKVLNSKDYGIPQNRERVFVVSILGKHKPFRFPQGFELKKTIFDLLECNIDDKYLLSEKCIDKMKRFEPKTISNSNISPTLTTELSHSTGKNLYPKLCKIIGEYRRITPREAFRLMGLDDRDIDKIQSIDISDTQQYKMAGNSIVIQVLEQIFKNLFLS